MDSATSSLSLKVMALFALAASSLACGRQGIVRTDAIPVRRVIVYRNGVAYFERAGHVDAAEVRFRMKPSEVGDFLATLAVMERGGSSVRAAAFPLDLASDDPGSQSEGREGAEGEDSDDASNTKHARGEGPAPSQTQTVLLTLDGKSHDLKVGYVAESPVWRPSYRLVVQPGGQADLQAWGIVENLSGEDWKNVSLSLVAGAPLAFRAELGTPSIPPRPIVTDEGEVIAAVPHGDTSLAQSTVQDATPANAPPPKVPPAEAPAPEDKEGGAEGVKKAERQRAPGGAADAASLRGRALAHRTLTLSAAPPPPSAAEPAGISYSRREGAPAVSKPRDLQSLAAIAAEGATTRYDLPQPVTVPDKSATMVMLLSRAVAGEALFLFAPDGGVPDSASHPFRVARFTNGTGAVLEKGPIAVFDQGSFLGQGMLDPLPAGATATVPFALERGIALDTERKYDELGGRVVKIEEGELTIERDRVTQTKYRVRNGDDTAAKVLVRHPRNPGTRLFSPPPGTDDNVGTGAAIVPATAPAHATVDLVVDERATERQSADWFSPTADAAVKQYIADPRSDRAVAQALASAWTVRTDIVKKRDDRAALEQQSSDLSRQSEETRRNLRAIEKNKSGEALRQKLTARLADAATRLDDFNRRIVEIDASLAELGVRFKEAVRDIHLAVPVASPPGG